MFSGLTNWTSQYGELSTKLTLLFASLLTVLMVFYGKKYLEKKDRKSLVTASGVCGMVYASFALVAGFACLWLLIFILFDKLSLGFLVGSVLVILVGISVAVKRHSEGNIRGGKADPRFKEIVDGLSNQGDANRVVQLAALMALMIKPEEPEAEELFRAARANLNVTRSEIPLGAATSLTQSQSTHTESTNAEANRERKKNAGVPKIHPRRY